MSDKITNPDIVKCRFCNWTVSKTAPDKNGKKRDVLECLTHHVQKAHKNESRRIARSLPRYEKIHSAEEVREKGFSGRRESKRTPDDEDLSDLS